MGGDISGNGMGEDFGFWDGFDPSSEFQRRQAATAAEKVKDAKQQQTMPHQLTVAERTERQKANYSQLEDVISVRNPSAWNRGSKLAGSGGGSATPKKRPSGADASSSSQKRVLAPSEEAMANAEADENSREANAVGGALPSTSSSSSSSGGSKAEVGSAIDLRKLQKAKKVQVFRGPGRDIMVVGARRLVVIDARPTAEYPHQVSAIERRN
jgi:hypothetical protein